MSQTVELMQKGKLNISIRQTKKIGEGTKQHSKNFVVVAAVAADSLWLVLLIVAEVTRI